MRKLKMPDTGLHDPQGIDATMPVFAIEETRRGWQVWITWPGGEDELSIGFVSRADAEIWIARDARDWLVRLRALSHSSPSADRS